MHKNSEMHIGENLTRTKIENKTYFGFFNFALRLTIPEISVENYQNMHKSAKLCIKIQKCILGKT